MVYFVHRGEEMKLIKKLKDFLGIGVAKVERPANRDRLPVKWNDEFLDDNKSDVTGICLYDLHLRVKALEEKHRRT